MSDDPKTDSKETPTAQQVASCSPNLATFTQADIKADVVANKASSKKVSTKGLTARQKKFVQARLDGLSNSDAARKAGYAETSVNSQKPAVNPRVKATLAELLLLEIPLDVAATKIREGINACETKIATFEGQITDTKDFIAWGERRAYLELWAKLTGNVTSKVELTGAGGGPLQIERYAHLSDAQLVEARQLIERAVQLVEGPVVDAVATAVEEEPVDGVKREEPL